MKNNSAEKNINWVSVGNGQLAIGHRPSAKLCSELKLQNVTHILTLISENEGANTVKSIAKKNNLDWLWFPMENAMPPSDNRNKEIADLFLNLKNILKNEGKIYMHCSAGIHRTGMIANAFLQFLGYTKEESLKAIKKLREVTIDQVGDHRIAWGNFINTILGNIQK